MKEDIGRPLKSIRNKHFILTYQRRRNLNLCWDFSPQEEEEVKLTFLMASGNGDVIVKTVDLLLESLGKKLPTNLLSQPISMVPSGLRDISPSSYDPRVVSIGPLHRKDQNVQAFEELKGVYAQTLLKDLKLELWETLNKCVKRVVYSIEQIRLPYAGTDIDRYDDTELAKMMVTDACFILQFIRDIIESKASLTDLILYLVQFFNVFETNITLSNKRTSPNPHHILGFLEKCYCPTTGYSPSQGLASSANPLSCRTGHGRGDLYA
ncbi:unnamed protein product [Lactuca virosa]|uniref:Uncharacterized protein n=1 Tax=Lactuca virosa TaxID=75947 RepID=A0AAU9N4E1_9ASTR|nr:unnamed protein product [Lactuca virosa]